MPTYYEILGIEKDASPKQVKQAYRKLALLWHPDRNPTPEANSQFHEINQAYQILSNPEQRKIYDYWLNHTYLDYEALVNVNQNEENQHATEESFFNHKHRHHRRKNNQTTNSEKKTYLFTRRTINIAKVVNIAGFLFCITLLFDTILPSQVIKQTVTNRHASNIPEYCDVVNTQNFTIVINRDIAYSSVYSGKTMYVKVTPVLKRIKAISIKEFGKIVTIKPYYGIYSSFVFFILLMIASSVNGIFFERKGEHVVSSAILSIILFVLTLFFIFVS